MNCLSLTATPLCDLSVCERQLIRTKVRMDSSLSARAVDRLILICELKFIHSSGAIYEHIVWMNCLSLTVTPLCDLSVCERQLIRTKVRMDSSLSARAVDRLILICELKFIHSSGAIYEHIVWMNCLSLTVTPLCDLSVCERQLIRTKVRMGNSLSA